MQYIGKTTTSLYTRFTCHKCDIKQQKIPKGKKTLPTGKHFNSNGHKFDDLSIMVIELIKKKENQVIIKRDSLWIEKLCILSPKCISVEE